MPLLKLDVGSEKPRHLGVPDRHKRPDPFTRNEQGTKFGPKFQRLREVLDRPGGELELRAQPDSLAPERLMVFELQDSVREFAASLSHVGGIHLIDEDELTPDEDGVVPHLYLLVPDGQALRNIESLWRRWSAGQDLGKNFRAWGKLFGHLRDIRLWGPRERLGNQSRQLLEDEIDGREPSDVITLEIELVYRENGTIADVHEQSIREAINRAGGEVVNRARISGRR